VSIKYDNIPYSNPKNLHTEIPPALITSPEFLELGKDSI
jgi:hypothetical protein